MLATFFGQGDRQAGFRSVSQETSAIVVLGSEFDGRCIGSQSETKRYIVEMVLKSAWVSLQ